MPLLKLLYFKKDTMTCYTKKGLVSTKELKQTEHKEAINYTGIVPDQGRASKSTVKLET